MNIGVESKRFLSIIVCLLEEIQESMMALETICNKRMVCFLLSAGTFIK